MNGPRFSLQYFLFKTSKKDFLRMEEKIAELEILFTFLFIVQSVKDDFADYSYME